MFNVQSCLDGLPLKRQLRMTVRCSFKLCGKNISICKLYFHGMEAISWYHTATYIYCNILFRLYKQKHLIPNIIALKKL